MIYVVKKLSPYVYKMSLEDLLFGDQEKAYVVNNTSNTKTYAIDSCYYRSKFFENFNVNPLIDKLSAFNESHKDLFDADRHSLYREFHIPKKSGGLRKIDAPNDELSSALRELKTIFEKDFEALYHTSAFAYVKGRSTIDAVKRHQSNESKWFGKYDLHDFFGSTTLDFVLNMFSQIFPFSEVFKRENGRNELEKALSLAFLDGGLPQGTPISPTITNIMMIPVDFWLSNKLRNFENQKFVYTRYADDFLISSRYDFDFKKIEKLIIDELENYNAPFTINSSKTRYGSSAGSNWNLGVMLNKDNKITVGHKAKKTFQAMLASYILDKRNGRPWELSDVQVLDGYRSYYKMVEGETIDRIVEHVGKKFSADIMAMIKADLSCKNEEE